MGIMNNYLVVTIEGKERKNFFFKKIIFLRFYKENQNFEVSITISRNTSNGWLNNIIVIYLNVPEIYLIFPKIYLKLLHRKSVLNFYLPLSKITKLNFPVLREVNY